MLASDAPGASLTRGQGVGVALLVTACLLNIGAVYVFVDEGAAPWLVLAAGVLGMGEAWGGAFFLERKRLPLARLLCAAGAAEVVLYAVPAVRASVAGMLVLAGGVLSAVGLALAWSRR